jgi:hypothetical protein
MTKKINIKFIMLTFVFLAWASMWVSINALPYEIKDMTKSFVQFLNASRSIGAILFSLISLTLLFFFTVFNKIKKFSFILILFSLYFIFQLIGLINNDTRITDIHSAYLLLYALSTISILMIIDNQKYYKILPYFFYFALTILTIAYLMILSQSADNFLSIIAGNLYNLLHPDELLFYQAPPRVSGITRSFSIISLSLMVIFAYKKRTKVFSWLIFFLIVLFSMFIWVSQSRGTLICYYSTFIFFIVFLNDFSQFKKFLIIISVTFFSISISNEITKIIENNLLSMEFDKDQIIQLQNNKTNKSLSHIDSIKLNILEKKISKIIKEKKNLPEEENYLTQKPRFFEKRSGSYTSGRITLWKNALERYEKNKFFGYGPQADRIILFDPGDFDSGNNVSNTMIYALLSGGYFSLLCIILIYVYTAYMILKFFLINKIFYNKLKLDKENIFVVASITYSVFFMIRSLFENSFGVFSIDFLIVILSLFMIEKFELKKNI